MIPEMTERVTQFMFFPHKWVNRERFAAEVAGKLPDLPMQPLALMDHYMHMVFPPIEPAFYDEFANRLLLLSEDEWWKLGLGVSCLPDAGKLAKSIDGYQRRLLQTSFSQEEIKGLDSLKKFDDLPVFAILDWRDTFAVVNGGVTAAIEITNWPAEVSYYHDRKFANRPVERSVEGLTMKHVREICTILLPNLSWL